MDDVIICGAKRTAFGKFGGALSHIPAHELGGYAVKGALNSCSEVVLPNQVDEAIFGHVLTAGCGMNTARQASGFAGLSPTVTAYTVNMVCGSGMKAITLGALKLKHREANVVIAGGMESMSQAPHLIRLRSPQKKAGVNEPPSLPPIPKFGNMALVDSLVNDGLTDPVLHCAMGDTAEHVAYKFSVSRDDQDAFALRSHTQWASANTKSHFKDEIVSIPIDAASNIDADECLQDVSIEKMKKLPPVFEVAQSSANEKCEHSKTVTAGNCSSLNDGAAAVVLVSSSFLENKMTDSTNQGLARIVSWAQSGGQPELMGIEVIQAVNMALKKADWHVNDVDIWEINEAFASTTLVAIQQLGITDWKSKVNLNGGAIALGHPLGASGARLVVTLSHQLNILKSTNPSRSFKGVATACIGGGQAIAICLESLKSC